MEADYKDYYNNCLEEGKEFQDFVCEILFKKIGILITNFSSKKHQLKGENLQGIEIKYDKIFKQTGNLFIEVAEKSHPNNKNYVDSGIYRYDNSWLYIIGDYSVLYIFSIKELRKIDDLGKRIIKPTCIGFLIHKNDAENICIKKIII